MGFQEDRVFKPPHRTDQVTIYIDKSSNFMLYIFQFKLLKISTCN